MLSFSSYMWLLLLFEKFTFLFSKIPTDRKTKTISPGSLSARYNSCTLIQNLILVWLLRVTGTDMASYACRHGSVTVTFESSTNTCVCAQPDTSSNPNPNPNANPATKQDAVVNMQLNIVTCPTYSYKFIQNCCCTVCTNFICNCFTFVATGCGQAFIIIIMFMFMSIFILMSCFIFRFLWHRKQKVLEVGHHQFGPASL